MRIAKIAKKSYLSSFLELLANYFVDFFDKRANRVCPNVLTSFGSGHDFSNISLFLNTVLEKQLLTVSEHDHVTRVDVKSWKTLSQV